eukprot:7660838-Alexandrium_andersonii.AAC.1
MQLKCVISLGCARRAHVVVMLCRADPEFAHARTCGWMPKLVELRFHYSLSVCRLRALSLSKVSLSADCALSLSPSRCLLLSVLASTASMPLIFGRSSSTKKSAMFV